MKTIKTAITAHKEKFSYISINLAMALLGFIRSYITMKYLGFYEVGLIAMVMSIIEFVSMFQMGLLNGGFRMYFVNTNTVNEKINSLLFTYFSILFFVAFIPFAGIAAYNGGIGIKGGMLIIGVMIGVVSLMKNWLTNLLIARQKYGLLNKVNIFSTLLSFLSIFLVPWYGLVGSTLLIVTQPIIFCVYVLISVPELRPSRPIIEKKILRKLMAFGFIPFLAGVLVKIDDQIERWGIINIMGVDSLGKYNLVLIYSSVFMLVPASINPIFFPRAILQFKNLDKNGLKKTLKIYTLILLGYLFVAIGVTAMFLPYIINLVLPKYNDGVKYVWYIIPYLAAQILVMPLDFIYTLTAKYRVMFISYVIAVVVFAILIFYISILGYKSLEYFAIAKSGDGLIFLLVSLFGYHYYIKKKINGLYTKA